MEKMNLRKRREAEPLPAAEGSGERAKRAAAELLACDSKRLRKLAREHGTSPALVKYYADKWRGTAIETHFVEQANSEAGFNTTSSEGCTSSCRTPSSKSSVSKPFSSLPDDWHLLDKHNRKKWVARQAAALVAAGKSFSEAMQEVKKQNEANPAIPNISRGTLSNYVSKPGRSPVAGGHRILPREFNKQVVKWILARRALKFPVFKEDLLAAANRVLDGTEIADRLKHKEVRNDWYYRLLEQFADTLDTANQRPIEMSRARWSTSKNLKQWYRMIAEILVQASVAVWNPDFKEDARPPSKDAEMIFITKPDRVLSFDESRLELDMTQASKSKKERTVVDKNEPSATRNETLAHKGGLVGTGVGGSTASAKVLRALFVIGSGGLKPAWCRPVPRCDFFDEQGHMLQSMFTANEKGGVKDEIAVQYLRDVVLPCFPDISAANPIVIICDGHGSHLSLELIEFARANHVLIALRVPHTSHITQGEDVSNFNTLKSEIRILKSRRLQYNIEKKNIYRLEPTDFMQIVAPAWDAAFERTRNVKGWSRTGLFPFTRSVMHELYDSEQRAQAHGVPLNYDHLNVVHESSESEGENEDDNALVMQGRISSAQLYALGPVTGDRAYAIVKGRHDKKQDEARKAQEAKEARAEKRSAAEQALMAEGQKIVVTSEMHVKGLTIPRLQAWLLVNDPLKWEQHKKLKSRSVLVEAALTVFRSRPVPVPAPAMAPNVAS